MLWPQHWEDRELRAACEPVAADRDVAFLLVPQEMMFPDWVSAGGMPSELPWSVVVLLRGEVLRPLSVLEWREGLSHLSPPVVFRILRTPAASPPAGWKGWLANAIGSFGLRPVEEPLGLRVGSHVEIPDPGATLGSERGYDPYVLAVPPDGPLASVLTHLDAVRRTFEAMRPTRLKDARGRVHSALDELLRNPSQTSHDALRQTVERSGFSASDRTQLPRVLLLGESGTGKTVLSRYLASHKVDGIPFDRVPIPEYLGREDHFESDVFGYCQGAHTDAREAGSRGVLGELVGGVVFFDEIGDANATIQAKLLAYLDDYVVRPRGFAGRGYYCPTLVVAATNRKLLQGAAHRGLLRHDLLNRFNEVIRVPSLSDRADEVDLQVDLLLQLEAFGAARATDRIMRVGQAALSRLRALDFKDRNFRLLERVLSTACNTARSERRDYLVLADVIDS